MATKESLIETLQSNLDTQAGNMATAIETFRTAYIAAHAADLAILKLGGQERGQRMDQDRLHTVDTPAHVSYREAETLLFDGLALQPTIKAEADSIISTLQSEHPEAF